MKTSADILAELRGRRVILRPFSIAGGMFLSEGGEQRRDGSLVVTTGDYDFLVRRAAELGLEIAVPEKRSVGADVQLAVAGGGALGTGKVQRRIWVHEGKKRSQLQG